MEINELIERSLKVDTSSLSDALDSLGLVGCLPGIRQQVEGTTFAGPAFTVRYGPYDEEFVGFRGASNYLDEVPEGAVVVIDNQGKGGCTVWGDILSEYAVQKGVAATVIHGAARDISEIRALQYPLFSSHIYMRSGKNRVTKQEIGGVLGIHEVTIAPGDWVIGDANGCLVIPRDQLEEVLRRAEAIERTESKIRAVVAAGMGLKEARALHGYHAPWEELSNEVASHGA